MTDNSIHPHSTAHAEPFTATPYVSRQPRCEGWGIFDYGVRSDGTPRMELQRIDFPDDGEPPFADDAAAWDHVVAQARAGSEVHRQALALVDPVERCLIEARCGWWPGCGQ